MEVTIRPSGLSDRDVIRLNCDVLEVSRMLASTLGFDLDIEPGAPGHAKLTARHQKTNVEIIANGTSVRDAAKNLINLLADRCGDEH